MKIILGWVLFIWGLFGLIGNIAGAIIVGGMPVMLGLNSIVCLLFIWGGWKLSHPKAEGGGQVGSGIRFKKLS